MFGIARSRWTLPLLRQHCPALKHLTTDGGVWRRLRKWRIAHKQGRLHLHSPDPAYQTKVEAVRQALEQSRSQPEAVRLLYADEVSFYRQPVGGGCWFEQGKQTLRADLSHSSNTRYRIAGALDTCTGQVHWHGASKVGVKALCRWLGMIRSFYGESLRLVVAWDNWPVHKHETVEAAAQRNRIEFLYLPTYAPWTNPIEKLWRKMKQETLRLHRHSDDWTGLRERVAAFLNRFAAPSPDLLRYVGLQGLAD